MSGDNAPLTFDPSEKVVAHSVEHHHRQADQTSGNSSNAAPTVRSSTVPRPQPTNTIQAQTQARATQKPYAGASFSEGPRPADNVKPAPVNNTVSRVEQPAPDALTFDNAPPQKVGNATHKLPLVTTTARVITASHEDVWLPSGFVNYEWKDIQVRRFNVEEVRAVVRARTSGNLRHLIRAVDGTLSRPVTDLTIGDFWYLMYWHRLNSYKKSPFIIEWLCSDHQHVQWVKDGVRPAADEAGEATPIEAKSLRNLLTVNKSNLATQQIDQAKFAELQARLLTEYGVSVCPQSLVDFVSATDEDEALETARIGSAKSLQDASKTAADAGNVDETLRISNELDRVAQDSMVDDEERSFSYRYAALLSTTHGVTLADRVRWLDQQSPDLLVDLEEVLETSDHGVTESWTVNCMECSASATVNQSLDALTFLPSLQRGGLT